MCNNCKKPYYITTAIAYTSGKPHIGNTYEIVLADSIARYKREQGYDVRFQTGTDEHGQKIELKAEAAGVTPQVFVDGVADEIKRIWDLMNTSYDKFIRTTDKYHEEQVQKMFKKMYDKGDIYKGYYEGMYCTPCESFFTESQLVDGKCPDCGRPVQPAKEEAYFFKMSKYADRLIQHINEHPEFIQPVSRKNEMMNNFLLPGLQDLCVSRTSFKWGIPVDFDDRHVVYVWLDALTNYITGVGFDADGNKLSLTILRSAIFADHFANEAKTRDEFCEFMEQGIQRFSYAVFPFAGCADADRQAAELQNPLASVTDTFHKGSLPLKHEGISVSADNVVISAIKQHVSGKGITLRCYEAEGRDTDVKITLLGTSFEFRIPHNSVKTFCVCDGKARETDFIE